MQVHTSPGQAGCTTHARFCAKPGVVLHKTGHIVGVEVFLLIMGVWLMIAAAVGLRRSAPDLDAARAVRTRIDAIYREPHEFTPADPAAFPEADLAFYQRAQRELTTRHFVMLADVEDLTITRAYPTGRTFMRLFVDHGGLIRASAYHVAPRGVVLSILQLVQVVPRHMRVLELVTEIGQTFITTANTGGSDRLDAPPEVQIERMPPSAGLGAVVARHQQRVAEALRQAPDRLPTAMETYDDVMASMARAHVALARYRNAVGGISRDELTRLKGRPLTAYEEAFLQAVQDAASPPQATTSDAPPSSQQAKTSS